MGGGTSAGAEGVEHVKLNLCQVDAFGERLVGGNPAPYDSGSRFFVPSKGVQAEPVPGSMHATLTPFWAKRLGKKELRAYQASPRGGDLLCTDEGDRVILSGPCALYLRGE